MVFIGGPRQIGKTTLAGSFVDNYSMGHPAYLNWDNETSRRIIQKQEWDKNEPIIIFDEIHKRKGWQSFIKGIFDTWKAKQKFIVTGSARLDLYRKGGDSMLGRYHYYCLHPYSLNELGNTAQNLEALMTFGGFPEPLLMQDERELRRWHLQRVSKLVRVDLRDLENVSDLDKVEILAETLPERVGSLLSYKSLAEDLEVSDKTVKRWVQILDSLYYCYLLHPYGSKKIKALKKAQKLYLWDWSQISDQGARFENMVASHLLKYCDFQRDVMGEKFELYYIRSDAGKECDFVVLKNRKPLFAVECKLSEEKISQSFFYLKSKLTEVPMWYHVHLDGKDTWVSPDLAIMSFSTFCDHLKLV